LARTLPCFPAAAMLPSPWPFYVSFHIMGVLGLTSAAFVMLGTYAKAFVTFQVIAATAVLARLRQCNTELKKRMQRAQACTSKPTTSLFELPAFQGKPSTTPPFENTTWSLPLYEQLKLAVMAVTLFPVRLAGFLTTFLCTYAIVVALLRLGLPRAAKLAIICGCRTTLFCFGFLGIRVKGEQATGVGVVVSNHSTFLDGLVWTVVSMPRIFAERSNFENFIMKAFAEALDIVLFDRGGQKSRQEARTLMASAATDAAQGKASPILVFPTGTTTNQKVMITFKDGAFAPGQPVQPAILRYRFRHCDPSWVFSGPGTLMLVFRLMCQFVNFLEVEFLPVCAPSDEQRREPQKFARRVQHVLSEAMGVPETAHSVEDLQLELAAVKANLPAEIGVVGFPALKEVFSVDANQIKQQMHVFKAMDTSGSGLVGFEDFKNSFGRGFHEPSTAQQNLLRDFFDQLTSGSEQLDFRKFLIGLALVNENGHEREATAVQKGKIYAKLAFAAFASESDDKISWREFNDLWNWLNPDMPSQVPSVDSKEEPKSALAVFERIADQQGCRELSWDKFSMYAEKNPDFEKRLRQAFFSRLANDLAPFGKQ